MSKSHFCFAYKLKFNQRQDDRLCFIAAAPGKQNKMSNNHWQKDKRVGVDDLVLLNTVCWSISSGKYSSALFDQLIFHLLDFNFLKTNAAMDLKCSIVDKKQNALNGIF